MMENPGNNGLNKFLNIIISRKLFIFSFVLFCVLSTIIYSLIVDNIYQASALVLLSPPTFREAEPSESDIIGDLAPKSLSVKTYKDILLNESVLSELREKLNIKDKSGKPIFMNALRRRLSVKIAIIQETSSGINYSPAMKLLAQAGSPEKAVILANTWADIAVEKAMDIAQKSKEGAIDFLSAEYDRVKKELDLSEDKLQKTEVYYDENLKKIKEKSDTLIKELRDLYDSKITDLKIESESLYKEDDIETFGLKRDLQNEFDDKLMKLAIQYKIDLKKIELETLKVKIDEFQKRLLDLQNLNNTLESRLVAIENEIKKHPEKLVLSKAITDDALWDKIAQGKTGKLPDHIKKLKLRVEEVNPVYVDLMTELAKTRVELNTKKSEMVSLIELLDIKSKERDSLDEEILTGVNKVEILIREKETEFEKLDRQRESKSKSLFETQNTKYNLLLRESKTALDLLTRERELLLEEKKREKELECDRLTREVENLNNKNQILASKKLNAQITEQDKTPDIRKIYDAVIPDQRIYPKRKMMVIVSFFASLIFALIYVNLAYFLNINFKSALKE